MPIRSILTWCLWQVLVFVLIAYWATLFLPMLSLFHTSLLSGMVLGLVAGIRHKSWVEAFKWAWFWPLLSICLVYQPSVYVYLGISLFLLGLNQNAIVERVPFYRSNEAVLEVLVHELDKGAHLLEIGCADAKLALALAKARPDLLIDAYESAPIAYLLAYIRYTLAGSPQNVQLHFKNFWRISWHDYQYIYAFLSPEPMNKVFDKFTVEAQKQAYLISNSFKVDKQVEDFSIELTGSLQTQLLFWRKS